MSASNQRKKLSALALEFSCIKHLLYINMTKVLEFDWSRGM